MNLIGLKLVTFPVGLSVMLQKIIIGFVIYFNKFNVIFFNTEL